jgi:cell division septal protein FtsQ
MSDWVEELNEPLGKAPGLEDERGERRGRLDSILKKVLVVCVALLAAEVVWLFVVNPSVPFSKVNVTGLESGAPGGLSRAEILKTAGVASNTSYLGFDAVSAQKALEALPQIAAARVTKRFPNVLTIFVQERVPAAAALVEIDGRSQPVLIDSTGLIFQAGGFTGKLPASTPLISGLSFKNIRAGARLPAALKPLMEDIASLRENAPEVLAAISEICVIPNKYENYELAIWTDNSQAKILLGHRLDADKIRYALLLADVLAEKGIDAKEIDYRTETASYILKNVEGGKNG